MNKKHVGVVILGMVIIVQIIYTTYVFRYVKQGAYSDEVWSYGLANSEYQPFIDLKKGVSSQSFTYADMINWEEWIPGKTLKDYITVQEGERFHYGSVYYNNTYDLHPPLYYMLLHTVCSFFPEQFSWWYGFALSLLFLIGTQIFLYLMTQKITKSEILAVITCVLYGGSMGAVHTYTFIRQYSLLGMLCMIFVYFSACFYEKLNGDQISRKDILLAALHAWLAFLTQYYGIVFVGFFTVAFCVYLIWKRKIYAMFLYGSAMLIALGGLFLVYPVAFQHLLEGSEPVVTAFSPPVQIRILRSMLFQYNYGFRTGYFPTAFWNITLPLLAMGIIAALALLFPFRREQWFRQLCTSVKRKLGDLCEWLRGANYVPVFCLCGCVAVFEATAHGVDVYLSGLFVMRYISLTLPFIAMTFVVFVYILFSHLPKVGRIACPMLVGVVVVILFRVHTTTTYAYSFEQHCGSIDVVNEVQEKNVLVMAEHASALRIDITFFTGQLYKANAVCFTSGESVNRIFLQREGHNAKSIDYVIVDTNVFRLTDEEKKRLQGREYVSFGTEEEALPYIRTDLIKEMAGGRSYDILSIWKCQMGVYYILKFSK